MHDARPLPTERTATNHVYYSMTKGLCGTCKAPLDAKIVFQDQAVWFDKFCPTHGHQRCRVSSSIEWYLDALSFIAPTTPPRRVSRPIANGCPLDCGACPSHQQQVYLPVVPIISACNLDCPICYTINKNEAAHRMSADDLARILGHLAEDHDELDIINFTGGEPTLHPQLLEFVEQCRTAGVRRVTISTNGLKLRDEAYVRKLAALDARIVLSLDTFRPETDRVLLGANTVKAKLDALAMLERHDVATTILPAVAMGLNDDEVGSLLALVLARPHIRSLELHTMTFTGQGGVGFQRSARITIPDLHDRITAATDGRITWRDFVPSPLAHPHCYSICYVLCLDGGGYVPFARLASRATLFELLGDSLYIEPRERLEQVFRDLVDDLWADPDRIPESAAVLATVKRLLTELFPPGRTLSIMERQKISERAVKAIYIHSHMDEENFDVARVMKCPVGVPQEDGGNIPTCSYNVIYRERDARFADESMLHRMAVTRPTPGEGIA